MSITKIAVHAGLTLRLLQYLHAIAVRCLGAGVLKFI